jgi:hypothetical protein
MPRHRLCLAALAALCLAASAAAQDRRTKVLQDRETVGQDERWIYNNLDAARELADRDGRPLLVVLRCLP